MLKRKYGSRSNWKRIIDRHYAQTFLDSNEIKGYASLIYMIQVKEPLLVRYEDKEICIVDNGYMWLQHFPFEKHHSVTTMFDANGEIVQWYIDICYENGVENQDPWMDDLFLDIVLLPSGEIFLLDTDELEEALANGEIDQSIYDLAWNEARYLIHLLKENNFPLVKLAETHKELLKKQLQ